MTMANLNITNSIDNILHLTRPRRKTDSAVDKRPPIVLDSTPSLSKKPSAQVLQGLTRAHHRRRASLTTTTTTAAVSDPSRDQTASVPSSNSANKTSATLFSTLTTPPVPSLPPFLPLRQATSKQRLRYSSPADLVDMAAADPRDRRAEPHATSASSFAPASSKTSYLRPRFTHHHPSFLTSSKAGEQTAATQDAGSHARPSSAFSFEYHLPLHEEVLTASTPTATTATTATAVAQQALKPRQPQVLQIQRPRKHAQKSSVTIAHDPSSSSSSSDPSDLSDASSSARRPRLHERRSVPNFSLPHVVSQSSSISSAESSPRYQPKDESQELQLFHQKQELFHQRHQRHKSVSAPLSPIDQNILFTWKPGQQQQQQQQQQQENSGETTSGIINALRSNATKRKRQSTIIAQQVASRPWAKDAAAMPLSTLSYSPGTRSSFVADSKRRAAAVNSDGEHHTPSRNEDLFLNIARSDSTHRDSLARSESRRSRFGFNGASLRSPTSRTTNTRNTPSPEQLRTNNPLRGRHISSASVAHTSSASAHPLDDSSRPSRLSTAGVGSSARSTIGLPRSRLSRASLDASASSPKSPSTGAAGAGAGAGAGVDRRSSLHEPRVFGSSTLSTIRSASRQPSAEPADRTPDTTNNKTRQDGSESTLSTNAPSTVWDELEGLKSRIRNLELTGKLPPSSQTAMSSTAADRPRTAATTVTTAFSSPPKHKRKSSMAVPEPDVAQVHPLLQSALAKAKNVVSSEVYRTLENTINDAASLSVMLNSGSFSTGSASVANGYSTPDKHSKRKADSVCRGLTELCIALSDAQQQQQQAPAEEKATPNASDKEPSTPYTSFQRSPSFEPDSMMRRRSTSRALARLESRRTSLVNGVGAGDSSDNAMAPTTPDAKQATTPQERRQSQLFEHQQQQQQQPQTPPQTKPSSGITTGPRNRPSRLSVSMRASTYPAEPKSEPKPDDQDTLAERNTSHALALSRTLTDVGTPSSNRFNARNRLSTGYVPYRPSLPSSPQEPNFTPQTPQTPAAQTQAPPPPPPHQTQPQLQSQKSQQQEEDKKPGEEKTELPRSPSLQAISLRRSFMAPVNYTPGTARTGIQSGSRRFAITGYNSGAPSTVAETPDSFQQSALERQQESQQQEQQQEDILQKFATPSSKIASGYKPTTQKSRSRTGSLGTTLGTRRFGIRPRPVMNLENIVHL